MEKIIPIDITPKIFHIVYVSIATSELNKEMLAQIEQIAQKNNRQNGITGILVHGNKSFMQIIEGREDKITKLMSTIYTDTRHHSIEILRQEFIPSRQFSNWHMRLTQLSEIQMRHGVICDELFQEKNKKDKLIDQIIETRQLLLAFKNANT